jgi:hypothetical protein
MFLKAPSVGIETGWTALVLFPELQGFSLLHSVQTSSGAHPTSYLIGTGTVSPGVKRLRREANQPPPTGAEVKNGGAIPPLPHTFSWHSA